MVALRVVSDLHGKYAEFLPLLECDHPVVQLGDFGYKYDVLSNIPASKLVIIPGNHERYDDVPNWLHFLHTYGVVNHGLDFFYVRGAFSIDWRVRVQKEQLKEWPKTWFETEELPMNILAQAIEEYKRIQPELVLTHDCPQSISQLMGGKRTLVEFGYDPEKFRTRTQMALQAMLEEHRPKVWIFAHYHKSFDKVINNTRFICMPELGYLDIDSNLKVIYP